MDASKTAFRPIWRGNFRLNWKFAYLLVVIICIPRIWLVLKANASGDYRSVGLIMVVSAMLPFVFLSKAGRAKIGISRSRRYGMLVLALFTGIFASMLLHYLGESLYGASISNWYRYIERSYMIPQDISPADLKIMFAVTSLVGMTFSPIGEEFFFRGLVHEGIAASAGPKAATITDGLVFSLTHLAHFGFVYEGAKWIFLPMPAFIWVAAMFLVSMMFVYFKKKTGSLLGAIICHAGFNLGMIYSIFFY